MAVARKTSSRVVQLLYVIPTTAEHGALNLSSLVQATRTIVNEHSDPFENYCWKTLERLCAIVPYEIKREASLMTFPSQMIESDTTRQTIKRQAENMMKTIFKRKSLSQLFQ